MYGWSSATALHFFQNVNFPIIHFLNKQIYDKKWILKIIDVYRQSKLKAIVEYDFFFLKIYDKNYVCTFWK